MKLALLADIHANREAFAAVLARVDVLRVDQIVLLGDIVGYGPDPAWCCERAASLMAKGAVGLMGNHDAAVDGDGGEAMNPVARAALEWTRTQLGREHREFLAALPMLHRQGNVLFVHASAHQPGMWEYVTDSRTAGRCLRAATAHITCVGHVHVPQLWRQGPSSPATRHQLPGAQPISLGRGESWLAVIGAVGQPRDGVAAAAFGLLDTQRATLSFERVAYDYAETARKIRKAGLPLELAERLGGAP